MLSGTSLVVSRLSFGTARIHHLVLSRDRRRLLASALEHGFTHFDTSPYYGYGIAESELGHVLSGTRQAATVATKVGIYPPAARKKVGALVWLEKGLTRLVRGMPSAVVDWSIDRASKSLDESLRALRREWVDILFLHDPPAALLDADELLQWLEREKAAGKVRYWGLAGEGESFAGWVRRGHGIAQVIQARGRLHPRIDWLRVFGRIPQITFGYLAGAAGGTSARRGEQLVEEALRANPGGSVLVSTRRLERVTSLARVAERAA